MGSPCTGGCRRRLVPLVFGTLLRVVGYSTVIPYREVGYWAVLLTVGLVTVGTIVSLLASRPKAAAPDEFDE